MICCLSDHDIDDLSAALGCVLGGRWTWSENMTDAILHAEASTDKRFSGSILQFAIKTCIVAVVISTSTIFVAGWIIDDFKDALRNTTGAPFWGKVERELDRAADPASDLPPEKKQKLLNDVHVIAARWRPFLDAVYSEFQKSPGTNDIRTHQEALPNSLGA